MAESVMDPAASTELTEDHNDSISPFREQRAPDQRKTLRRERESPAVGPKASTRAPAPALSVRQAGGSQACRRAAHRQAQDAVAHNHACHRAVATFWARYAGAPTSSHDGAPRSETPATVSGRPDVDSTRPCEPSVPKDGTSQHEAMQAALAAARAELVSVDHELPPGFSPNADDRPAAAAAPVQGPPRLQADDDPVEQVSRSAGDVAPDATDLDADTATQLKLLRRLHPEKPQAELLAQLVTKKREKLAAAAKPKRKWLPWGRAS